VNFHTEFESAFKHCFVEIGAMSMPVWISVFFDAMRNEVYFTQDFAIMVSSEDKTLGINTILFEFLANSPTFK
jgi:TorA maturation chaperone TorD